jgi:hypothetical protein
MIGKGSHHRDKMNSMSQRGHDDADGGHFSTSIHKLGRANVADWRKATTGGKPVAQN